MNESSTCNAYTLLVDCVGVVGPMGVFAALVLIVLVSVDCVQCGVPFMCGISPAIFCFLSKFFLLEKVMV